MSANDIFSDDPDWSQALVPDAPREEMRSGRIADQWKALGLSVSLFMSEPNFARLPFGHWSRILTGQIRREHYMFAFEGNQLRGFAGWALTSYDHAEAWVTSQRELSFENSQAGDYVIVNAWVAKNGRTHRFLTDQMRRVGQGKQAYYFKRFYSDGRVRPVRLPVGAHVDGHVARGFTEPTS